MGPFSTNYHVHRLGNHYISRWLDIFAHHNYITQLLGKFSAPVCIVNVLYKYDLLYSDLGLWQLTTDNVYKNSPKTASTPILDRYFAYGGILSSCTLNDLKIKEWLHRPKIKHNLLINAIESWVLEKGELFCTQRPTVMTKKQIS